MTLIMWYEKLYEIGQIHKNQYIEMLTELRQQRTMEIEYIDNLITKGSEHE